MAAITFALAGGAQADDRAVIDANTERVTDPLGNVTS